MYEENYKTFMKKIKIDLVKIYICIYFSFNIVKMPGFSNFINRFNAIPVQILEGFFMDVGKLIVKFIWTAKRSIIWEPRHYPTSTLTIKLQ